MQLFYACRLKHDGGMADTQNIMNLWDELREEWEAGIFTAALQRSAHLSDAAVQFTSNAEYHRIQTRGSAVVHRIKERYQDIGTDELKYGERAIYPVGFYATQRMSSRDLIRKGGLPVGIELMRKAILEAADIVPDQVFLGVEPDPDKDGNCVIQPQTDKSYFYDADSDSGPKGTYQGLLGPNCVKGASGDTWATIAQQPYIGTGAASKYADYASDLSGLVAALTSTVPVNYAGQGATPADCGLTEAKMRYVLMALRRRHIDPLREEVWMAITPDQYNDLLEQEVFRNSLYGLGTCLKDGVPPQFMGIRFLVTVDVPIVNIGTQASPKWVRSCPVWVKSHVEFGVWEDPLTQFDRQPTKIDTYTCTVVFSYGAGRRSEKGVICVHCDEVELHKFDNINAPEIGGGGGGSGSGAEGGGAEGNTP